MTCIPSHSSFEVTSDAICFGSRTEVREGAAKPIQAPTFAEFDGGGGGTVLVHSYQAYNFRAQKGRWNVYRLVEPNGLVTAAFCCHEQFASDPYPEAKRILEVANSPYEKDNGTNRNTQVTWEGRVLVINRYDWGEDYYAEEEVGITIGEEDLMGDGQRNSRWLVDYQQAKDETGGDPVADWVCTGKGVRLVIFGEYIFGRFGLTDDRLAVHSFLMFTSDTQLDQTTFQNDPEANRFIYIPLTPEQRHAKRITEGSYLGYDWLRTSQCSQDFFQNLMPPFGVEAMIPLAQIHGILQTVQPNVPILERQLQSEMLELLNETLAVWIYSLGNIAETASSKEEFLKEAFSEAYGPNQSHIHAQILKKLSDMECVPPSIRHDMVHKIVPSNANLWTFVTVKEASCAVKYLLEEILELAGNCARDNERSVLVPCDLRIAINNDPQLCEEGLNTSRIFWPPDMIPPKSQEEKED